MKPGPPRYALKFLLWFCREDFIDEVAGDLTELYEKRWEQSPAGARWKFIVGVTRYLRPEYMKIFHRTHSSQSLITAAMIRSYFTLAFRNLTKRTAFSLINIFGLAMGIGSCLVILKYIDFETSYDKFNAKAASLYRLNRTFLQNGERSQSQIMTTYGLGPALADQIPEVDQFIRTHDEKAVISYQPASHELRAFHENKILVVDSTFLRAFTFTSLAGKGMSALDDPNAVVLTRSISKKYFGDEDPIGETLHLAGGRMDGDYTVSSVIEDVPQNSHLVFDILLPMHNIFLSGQYRADDGWGWNNFITYVLLNEGAKQETVAMKLPAFCDRNINPGLKKYSGSVELGFQPLRDIHLHPGLRHDGETISPNTIYFFGVIAGFILFIAWINYINLSTARAMERSREVGIKKAIGAFRSELITQFLVESILINFIGMVLAVLLAVTLLPVLGDIIGKKLLFDFSDLRLWYVLAVLFVAGTLASGTYPALVLSSFRMTSVLKGRVHEGRGISLRKMLVVFQFSASLLLIAGTFVVYRQVDFMQSQDKGLQMDQMLIVSGPATLSSKVAQQKLKLFKEEVRKIAGVSTVATSGAVPGGGHNWGADVRKNGTALSEISGGSVVWVDPDFIPTYEISFLAGRNFNEHIKSDMESVVINEASLSAYGLGTAEEALNEQLILGEDTVSVIGVVKNYNWSSLKSDYVPFVFGADTIVGVDISIHLESKTISSAVDAIGMLYKDLLPGEPFEYRFLDDAFNMQYKSDVQFGNIFGLFAGLAVAISCLGLWGLASFTTSQKLKEISVRKVLGASVSSIVYLLCSRYMLLVLLAALISVPIAWYGMESWLNGFAFRVGLQWDLFILPILLLALIALLTVSVQVLKGAAANPAKVLRSE